MKAIQKSRKYFTLFKKKWFYSPILLVVFLFFLSSIINKDDPSQLPFKATLWVWERPENLYFMKDESVTYAYLAGTATKTDKELFFYPRRQPLRIPDNSTTVAVTRIDDKSGGEPLTDSDMEQISDFVISSCTKSRENISCQIDFDATQSQINFYKKLLITIRNKLPTAMELSITSLVSWCTTGGDPWFADSPIDEVVPMFFRLGRDSNAYWQKVSSNKLTLSPLCQESIGVSTDEQLPGKKYLKDKKVYIFNNNYWDKLNWGIIKLKIENKLNEN